jgi:acyl carrier protein
VISVNEFVTLIRDELGLPVTDGDIGLELDRVAGWDSVHLLSLCTILERTTGNPLSLPDVLEAPTLARIYTLAVGE